jgi:hypothetical protein
MRKIFKYTFKITDTWEEQLPIGAEIKFVGIDLHVGDPAIWAIVDPAAPTEARRFRIYGTGHAMTELFEEGGEKYIGTFQRGLYVWHLFEVILEPI